MTVADTGNLVGVFKLLLNIAPYNRRIETLHTGMRWFDIKRLGLEYTRVVGKDAQRYHLGGILASVRSSNVSS